MPSKVQNRSVDLNITVRKVHQYDFIVSVATNLYGTSTCEFWCSIKERISVIP